MFSIHWKLHTVCSPSAGPLIVLLLARWPCLCSYRVDRAQSRILNEINTFIGYLADNDRCHGFLSIHLYRYNSPYSHKHTIYIHMNVSIKNACNLLTPNAIWLSPMRAVLISHLSDSIWSISSFIFFFSFLLLCTYSSLLSALLCCSIMCVCVWVCVYGSYPHIGWNVSRRASIMFGWKTKWDHWPSIYFYWRYG